MKCSSVQSLIVEYAEGALGPADEMCIDIHLIQCEECRAEMAGLRDLIGTVARGVHACEACDDAVEFLDRFHAMAAAEAPPPSLKALPRWGRLPMLRLAAAAVALILALSSGVFGGRGAAWIPVFSSPVVEARTRDFPQSDWSPYLRNGLNRSDLDKMGLLPDVESHPAPGGD